MIFIFQKLKLNLFLKLKQKREGEDSYNVKRVSASHTLTECISRRTSDWSKESVQYKYCPDGILQMLITTGYPVTFMNDSSNRESFSEFDPKFVLPGPRCVFCSSSYSVVLYFLYSMTLGLKLMLTASHASTLNH